MRWKLRLLRHLYEGGFQRGDIVQLFRFIDWLLSLPPQLEQQFKDEITRLKAEKKMRYVTSIERLGIEQVRKAGVLEVLTRQLMRRFESLPAWAEEREHRGSGKLGRPGA